MPKYKLSLEEIENPASRSQVEMELGTHGLNYQDTVAKTGIRLGEEKNTALVNFHVHDHGLWLVRSDTGVHVYVNGRQIRKLAMLRAGDKIHVDGKRYVLHTDSTSQSLESVVENNELSQVTDNTRTILRGVGGVYHGQSFALGKPIVIGSHIDAQIRLSAASAATYHATIQNVDGRLILRHYASDLNTEVNGRVIGDALLQPGDQIAFDHQSRFVLESPLVGIKHAVGTAETAVEHLQESKARQSSIRHLQWVILGAVFISAALVLLLLYGHA